jgi:hypothetical protein
MKLSQILTTPPKLFRKFANGNTQDGKNCFKEYSEEQQWAAIVDSV